MVSGRVVYLMTSLSFLPSSGSARRGHSSSWSGKAPTDVSHSSARTAEGLLGVSRLGHGRLTWGPQMWDSPQAGAGPPLGSLPLLSRGPTSWTSTGAESHLPPGTGGPASARGVPSLLPFAHSQTRMGFAREGVGKGRWHLLSTHLVQVLPSSHGLSPRPWEAADLESAQRHMAEPGSESVRPAGPRPSWPWPGAGTQAAVRGVGCHGRRQGATSLRRHRGHQRSPLPSQPLGPQGWGPDLLRRGSGGTVIGSEGPRPGARCPQSPISFHWTRPACPASPWAEPQTERVTHMDPCEVAIIPVSQMRQLSSVSCPRPPGGRGQMD